MRQAGKRRMYSLLQGMGGRRIERRPAAPSRFKQTQRECPQPDAAGAQKHSAAGDRLGL